MGPIGEVRSCKPMSVLWQQEYRTIFAEVVFNQRVAGCNIDNHGCRASKEISTVRFRIFLKIIRTLDGPSTWNMHDLNIWIARQIFR